MKPHARRMLIIAAGIAVVGVVVALATIDRWMDKRGDEHDGAATRTSTSPAQQRGDAFAFASLSDGGRRASTLINDSDERDKDGGGEEPTYNVEVDASPWFFERHRAFIPDSLCDEATVDSRVRYTSDSSGRDSDGGQKGATPANTTTLPVHGLGSYEERCPKDIMRSVRDHRVFDYDGDGVPELVLIQEQLLGEGVGIRVSDEQSDVFTRRPNGMVAEYGRLDGGSLPGFSAVDDADGDGRPDLASRLTYTERSFECASGFIVQPIFLFHSLKNGDFASRDAVVKAYFDKKCGTDSLDDVMDHPTRSGGVIDLGTAIVCLRVRGTPFEAIERILKKRCATFSSNSCDTTIDADSGKQLACPDWTLELAKKAPPLRW